VIEEDRGKFSELMAMLAEVFGAITALRIQAYWMALMEYDVGTVEAATMRCIRTRKSQGGYPATWPTPGDLIALMYRGLEDTPDPPARMDRKALTAAPPDPEARAKIRALIRQVIEGLPDSPRRGEAGAPQRKAAVMPKSRREILREMFLLGANYVGECAALAVRAGYLREEIAEAMREAQTVEAATGPTEPDQPWLQEARG
jgi:hypothetical protein